MLRDTLYHHAKPAVVMSYVLACRYYSSQPLNTHQMGVLANASSKGDYSEFDITLVYSLLRNLTPTKTAVRPTAGWGRPVAAGDIALGDDIERIREIRNEMYGHVATTFLSDSRYTHYMQVLSYICSRMDTVHSAYLTPASPRPKTYFQDLAYIKTVCMDPDMEGQYIEQIRRMKETDKDTRELIEAFKKDAAGNTCILYVLICLQMLDLCYKPMNNVSLYYK